MLALHAGSWNSFHSGTIIFTQAFTSFISLTIFNGNVCFQSNVSHWDGLKSQAFDHTYNIVHLDKSNWGIQVSLYNNDVMDGFIINASSFHSVNTFTTALLTSSSRFVSVCFWAALSFAILFNNSLFLTDHKNDITIHRALLFQCSLLFSLLI